MRNRPGWPIWALLLLAAHPIAAVLGVVAVVAVGVFGVHGIALPAALFAGQLLIGLLSGASALPGPLLRPSEQPEVVELVQEVADRVGYSEPIAIAVIPIAGAAMGRARLHGTKVTALLLGLPYLERLSRRELAAVIAHELAHHEHVGDRRTHAVARARDALAARVEDGARLPRLLGTRLLQATQPFAFALELESDAAAVRVVGTEAVRSALDESERLGQVFSGLVLAWLERLEEQELRPTDLFEAYDVVLADPVVQRAATRRVDPVAAFDTHPTLAQRLADLPDVQDQGWGTGPVGLRDVQGLRDASLQVLLGIGPGRTVSILSDPELVQRQSSDAQDALRELTGCDTVQDALAQRQWYDGLDPDLQEDVVGATARLVADELRGRGWTQASPWLGSVLLDEGGAEHDLRLVVETALGDGRTEALLRLLG